MQPIRQNKQKWKRGSVAASRPATTTAERRPNRQGSHLRWKSWHRHCTWRKAQYAEKHNQIHCFHALNFFTGTQPSPTPTSPRGCPRGQYSCPPPGGCIDAALRCDGIPHCPNGEDEIGCYPHDQTTQAERPNSPTPAPLRTPSMAAVTLHKTTPTPTVGQGIPDNSCVFMFSEVVCLLFFKLQ